MGWLVGALLGGLVNIASSLVGRVLIALGVAVVTTVGIGATVDFFENQFYSNIGQLPQTIIGMLALMKVGTAIGIYTGAIAGRLVISGLTGDTIKRFVKR